MSRETKPWLPLYVDDFLGDETVKLASNRALGVYVKLLCHQWRHKSVPANHDELAVIVGESRTDFDKIWPRLREKFPEKSGRLINPRMEVERRQADRVLRARRKAARSTNAHRDGHRTQTVAQSGRRPGGESQSQSQSHTQTHKDNYTPEFETAWKAYPKRQGGNSKRAAYRQWQARLAEGVTAETMIAGTRRYAAECADKLGSPFVKQAATFYGRDRHFEYDEPVATAPVAPTSKLVAVQDGVRLKLVSVPLSDPRPAA